MVGSALSAGIKIFNVEPTLRSEQKRSERKGMKKEYLQTKKRSEEEVAESPKKIRAPAEELEHQRRKEERKRLGLKKKPKPLIDISTLGIKK